MHDLYGCITQTKNWGKEALEEKPEFNIHIHSQ